MVGGHTWGILNDSFSESLSGFPWASVSPSIRAAEMWFYLAQGLIRRNQAQSSAPSPWSAGCALGSTVNLLFPLASCQVSWYQLYSGPLALVYFSKVQMGKLRKAHPTPTQSPPQQPLWGACEH